MLRRVKISEKQKIVLSAWISRILIVASQLLAVRVLLSVLGIDAFAVWTLLTSLTAWFLIADLGLGQVTQNNISLLRAQGKPVGNVVRSAIRGVFFVGLLIGFVLISFSGWLAPLLLNNFLDKSVAVASFSVAIAFLVPSAWSTVAAKVWYAQGYGVRANVLPAISTLFSLICVIVIPPYIADLSTRLVASIFLWLMPTALTGIFSLLWIYIKAPKDSVENKFMPEWRPALAFWSYAVLGIITLNVDYLILGNVVSSENLVEYSILSKLFGFILFFYTATMAMYSPHVTAAKAKGSLKDIYKIISLHIRFSLIAFAVVFFIMWWMLPYALENIFKADQIKPNIYLYISFSVLYMIRVWVDAYAMFLGALGEVRILGRFLPFQAISSVSFQWLLANQLGVYGIVLGILISYLLTVCWALPLAAKKIIDQSN